MADSESSRAAETTLRPVISTPTEGGEHSHRASGQEWAEELASEKEAVGDAEISGAFVLAGPLGRVEHQ